MRFFWFCLLCLQLPLDVAAVPSFKVGVSNNIRADHPHILLMREAYQQLGYQMELVVMPLQRSAYESNKGQLLDAELSRTAQAAAILPNMIRVKVPLGQVRITAFSRDPAIKIKDWQSLKTWRVDVLRGLYLATLNMSGQHYTEVNSIEQAMQRLLSGRADIAVLLGDETQWYLQQKQQPQLYALTPDLAKAELYHYVHERHAAVVPKLEAALSLLTQKTRR